MIKCSKTFWRGVISRRWLDVPSWRPGTLPGRAAPSRAVINPVQSCSFRHALIAALCVTLNVRQFVTAAFLTNLSFSAPIYPLFPFFYAALLLGPSSAAFPRCTSTSLSSSPTLLYSRYSYLNKNDIWAAIPICPKSPVFRSLRIQIRNLIYLPRFFFLSRPCFLTSIISHHPSWSLREISLDIAVMWCTVLIPPPVDHFTSFTQRRKRPLLILPNVLNLISVMSVAQINCSKN